MTGSARIAARRMGLRCTSMLARLRGQQCIHLLHIRKTGGTAVKHALKDHPTNHRYRIFLHPHAITLSDIPRGQGVIFFLRDPIARFISGFNSRKRQGRPTYYVPWGPEERIAFENFDTPNALAMALYCDDPEQRAKAEFAMNNIRHVRHTYLTWFKSEEYFLSRLNDITFIGFQESLAEDFELLKRKLDLPAHLVLPTDEVRAHRTPGHFDQTLEPAAQSNLRRWFDRDYQFLELCRQHAPRINQMGLQAV